MAKLTCDYKTEFLLYNLLFPTISSLPINNKIRRTIEMENTYYRIEARHLSRKTSPNSLQYGFKSSRYLGARLWNTFLYGIPLSSIKNIFQTETESSLIKPRQLMSFSYFDSTKISIVLYEKENSQLFAFI